MISRPPQTFSNSQQLDASFNLIRELIRGRTFLYSVLYEKRTSELCSGASLINVNFSLSTPYLAEISIENRGSVIVIVRHVAGIPGSSPCSSGLYLVEIGLTM